MTLESVVAAAFGPDAEIRRHRPFPYTTSHPIEELVVDTGGSTVEVLVKALDPSSVVAEAQGVAPAFLLDAGREAEVYRTLLPRAPGGTARMYTAEDGVLVLEKVRGAPLWEVGDLAVWEEAARWLARLHRARLHERVRPPPRHLLRYDRRYYDRWLGRVASTLGARDADRLAAVHVGVVEELLALPQTLIHGEFYASNVLVSPSECPPRICPVDWEMAGVGPALVDLAALTSGWDGAAVARLVDAYRQAGGYGGTDRDLDLCRLHLCLRWAGWSTGWRPPAEHGRDWLGEAVDLAARLTA
jgi:aminoglycoside phosphotransferase (APT) family kinase protein